MDKERIKEIPYGISDYEKIVEKNYYYIDKTGYIPLIEDAGHYLFFHRPGRFGKSLYLSMMKYYYDIHYKEQFEKLFKGTWIFDNPTEEQGRYLVLTFNFSEVSPVVDNIEELFLAMVRDTARKFIEKYRSLLSESQTLEYFSRSIEECRSPSDIVNQLCHLANGAQQKMFVMIDNYDNFSTTPIPSTGHRDQTHLFLCTFFTVLKAGTSDTISRLFFTGISPVSLDNITSGFNIGLDASLNFNLNQILGFTENDVTGLIEYYRHADKIAHTTDVLMELMTLWYGNYLFSSDAEVPLFNSEMVLYFLTKYMDQQKIPDNLIDRNVRIDYGKLRHIILIDQDKNKPPVGNGNFSQLKEISESGTTFSKIADVFSLKEMAYNNNLKSFLFYFGLLTIDGYEMGRYRLKIPNETIKRIYYDYIESIEEPN